MENNRFYRFFYPKFVDKWWFKISLSVLLLILMVGIFFVPERYIDDMGKGAVAAISFFASILLFVSALED